MIHDVEELPKSRTPQLAQFGSGTTSSTDNISSRGMPLPSGGDGSTGTGTPPSRTSNWHMGTAALPHMHQQSGAQGDPLPGEERVPSGGGGGGGRGNPSRIRLGETRTASSATTATAGGGSGNNHSTSLPSQDEDTASVNSFQTAPSEPNLLSPPVSASAASASGGGFVPKQVSDRYETRVLGPAGAPGGAMQQVVSPRSPTPSFKGMGPDSHPVKVITRGNSYAAEPRGSGAISPSAPPQHPRRSPLPATTTEVSLDSPGEVEETGRAQVQKLITGPRSPKPKMQMQL